VFVPHEIITFKMLKLVVVEWTNFLGYEWNNIWTPCI